jgi:hypothetical protein
MEEGTHIPMGPGNPDLWHTKKKDPAPRHWVFPFESCSVDVAWDYRRSKKSHAEHEM